MPRNLNDSTAVTMLFYYGERGESRGVSPEVHSFERVQFQVVKTAPDSQLLNLLSVSRLVNILNEADDRVVICKLKELDKGVFRCAVVGVEQSSSIGGPQANLFWPALISNNVA